MSELYLKPFQNYLKQLCVEHVAVSHDDATNVAFIRLQTAQDIGSIRNNAAGIFIIIDSFIGRVKGSFEENRLREEISILFLKRTAPANGDPFGIIEDAQEAALEILLDFYARFKQDFDDDDCGPLKGLDATQMTFDIVDGPVEEMHYGWLLTIPLDVKLPVYNGAKWNRA